MKDFKQNHCRLCPLVLCCLDCRRQHEITIHKIINPDCDICIYGKAVITDPSDSLLEHIRLFHWPLHCVFCQKVYVTVDELKNHGKCMAQNNAPKTPVATLPSLKITEPDYSSPPLEALISKNYLIGNKGLNKEMNLATSTPVQNYGTPSILKNMLSLVGSNSSDKSNSQNLEKRKVTFCETPIFENSSANKTDEKPAVNEIVKTPNTRFFTINEEAHGDYEIEEVPEDVHDGTLWESALNNIDGNDDDIFKVIPIIDKHTPISANLKKRKKNIILQESINTEKVKQNIFASTKLGFSEASVVAENGLNESKVNQKNNEVFSNAHGFWGHCPKSQEDISSIEHLHPHNSPKKETKEGLWSSVSRLVKNVLAFSSENLSDLSTNVPNLSLKRSLSETDTDHMDYPKLKRSKYADIRGRKPIRDLNAPMSKFVQAPGSFSFDGDGVYSGRNCSDNASTSDEVPPKLNHANKATQTE